MDSRQMKINIKMAQMGDNDAHEVLYREYAKPVYYLALKLMKNKDDAEDITQEVFLTVFQRISELKEPEAFPTWLNKITANKCTNAIKKKHIHVDLDEFEQAEFIEEADPLLIPDKSLDNSETARMLSEITDNLPLMQRMCVYYYYYEHLTIAQIAEILNTNENTVKTRLAIARDKIRREIKSLEIEEDLTLYGAVPLMLTPALKLSLNDFEFSAQLEGELWSKINASKAVSVTPLPGGVSTAAKTVGAIIAGIALSGLIINGIGLPNREELPDINETTARVTETAAIITETSAPVTETAISDTETTAVPVTSPPTETTPGITGEPIPEPEFITINGEQYSIDTEELRLRDVTSEDLELLRPMSQLKTLVLPTGGSYITDITPLSDLTNLTRLELAFNDIRDLSPLSGLTNLTHLDLRYNSITDISPLSELTNLTHLNLSYNPITDVSPLSGLTNLTELGLAGNQISDISPLRGLTKLTSLDLLDNKISDLTPLRGLTNLVYLRIDGNNIGDDDVVSLQAALPDCNI